jgi:hypothetical protein
MAGYSGTPLVKKLGIKEGMVLSVVGAPRPYSSIVDDLPEVREASKGEVDFVHFFTSSASELKKKFPALKKRLKKTGMLWVSWPKGSSSLETDIKEDLVRKVGLEGGLVDVKVCAVDEDWSGLKFVYRLADRASK